MSAVNAPYCPRKRTSAEFRDDCEAGGRSVHLRSDFRISNALLLIGLLALVGCRQAQLNSDNQSQARQVADAYTDFDPTAGPQRRVTVQDAGQYWLVTYHVPEGWTGGERWVWVDKKEMKVAKFIGSQ